MTDVEAQGAPGGQAGRDKREWAEEVLTEILRLMGIRATLDVKEVPPPEPAAPGNGQTPPPQPSISVALTPEEDIPGLQPGKRSPIADALQFLANKIVNRGPDKRWINIGVGAHPEPRVPGQKAQKEKAAKEKAQKAERPARGAAEAGAAQAAPRPNQVDEAALEVEDDPALRALGRLLAGKAATYGRIYAVVPTQPAERVLMQRGASDVPDVSVKLEGEGRHRRIVFLPANPKPMPKRSELPVPDDEDELEDEE